MPLHGGRSHKCGSPDAHVTCLHRSSQAAADGGPWLHKVAAGGGLALAPPPPRSRPPELEARLAQLQKRLDEKQYAEMVSDITEEVTVPAAI